MDNHLLRFIGSFTRSVQYLCDVKYRELNLQKGQFMFLMRICEHPGISQQSLSHLISVEKSTTTKALQKLEKDGYILREKSSEDSRITLVRPTEKGLEVYSELARYELYLLKELSKKMSDEEYDVVARVFERVSHMFDITSHIANTKSPSLSIQLADTEEKLKACQEVRRIVFQVGQGVPEAIDFDGRDEFSDNLIAYYDNKPVGTVRLRAIDDTLLKLERLAVHNDYRGLAIGSALIEYSSAYAKNKGYQSIKLHAQMQALSIYLKAGYEIVGEPFYEADIKHILVTKALL